MPHLAQSPFEWLAFDKDGALRDPQAARRLQAALIAAGASDLVIISHGWKTDQAGAGELYTPLWSHVTQSLAAAGGPDPHKIVVGGVLWPSKPFRTDFDVAAALTSSGGTLSADPPVAGDGDLRPEALNALLDDYRILVGDAHGDAVAAAAAANSAGFDAASAEALLAALKASVDMDEDRGDPELRADSEGFGGVPQDVLLDLMPPPLMPLSAPVGGTLGLGDALSNAIMGPRAAVGRLLNQFTYYAMKQRAGAVGAKLGGVVLPDIASATPVRLHLVGHSFGARLVTAAAAAMPPRPHLKLWSLTLLQGAYSHNGMAANFDRGQAGAYAKIVSEALVSGPIVVTHTHNDSACTIAYPLASRLVHDTTQSLGDAGDAFGAMGANGPQHLSADLCADQKMVKGTTTYALATQKVNRLFADACVSEHMDVTNPDVGALVASALRDPVATKGDAHV